MIIKRINIEWSSMTGLGPAAWNRDHHILTMHTPHHAKDHQTNAAKDAEKAPIHKDEKTVHKER